MATLTPYESSLSGVSWTTSAVSAGGDQFINTGREVIYITNQSGASITVTFTGQNPSNFGVTSNKSVTVPDNTTMVIGPFLTNWFNDANGYVQVTYSNATSVTAAVLKVPDTTTAL